MAAKIDFWHSFHAQSFDGLPATRGASGINFDICEAHCGTTLLGQNWDHKTETDYMDDKDHTDSIT